MALYQPMNVTLALDILRVYSADDRYRGVEPYVVPIFFKVDGERYAASLRIGHSQQPRPDSEEQPAETAGGQIQLSIDSFGDGIEPVHASVEDIEEDNPLIVVPPGRLLVRGSLDSGEQVVMRDVTYTSTLIPIPFRIDVYGHYVKPGETFKELLVTLEELIATINFLSVKLTDLIGDLFGLDEAIEACPVTGAGASGFLNDIEAQFNALIAGTIGGVFVCMENDEFDEDLASDLRSSVRDEVASVINHTVNALNLTNTIPDAERFTNNAVIADNIASDLTVPVIADFAVSLGAIVASTLSGSIALELYGILTALAWIAGGNDDSIGAVTVTFDHSGLGPPGSVTLRSQIVETEGEDDDDDNRWDLSYTLTVNSVA